MLTESSLDCSSLGDPAPNPYPARPTRDDIQQITQELVAGDAGDPLMERQIMCDELLHIRLWTDLAEQILKILHLKRRDSGCGSCTSGGLEHPSNL